MVWGAHFLRDIENKMAGLDDEVRTLVLFTNALRGDGHEVELRFKGLLDVQQFANLVANFSVNPVESSVDEDLGRRVRLCTSEEKIVCMHKDPQRLPGSFRLLESMGFGVHHSLELPCDLSSTACVVQRRYKRRRQARLPGHYVVFTEVMSESPGRLPVYGTEIEVELIPEQVPVEPLIETLRTLALVDRFEWPPSVRALFGRVHQAQVRDLAWDDLVWDAQIFGYGRELSLKGKDDGVRGLLYYVVGNQEIVCSRGKSLHGYPLSKTLNCSFLIDGEFSRTLDQFVAFDLAYLNGWLPCSRRERHRLLGNLLVSLRLPFCISLAPWYLLSASSKIPEQNAHATFEALVSALEATETLQGTDGAIVACDDMPWSPRPNLAFAINSFKIKSPEYCTVDLVIFGTGLYADTLHTVPNETWNDRPSGFRADAFGAPAHFERVGTTDLEHPPGTVGEFVTDGERFKWVRERPDKFRKPNSLVQCASVQRQAVFPISAANLRKHALSTHVNRTVMRMLAQLPELDGVRSCGFPKTPVNAELRKMFPPLRKSEKAQVLVCHRVESRAKLLRTQGQTQWLLVFVHDLREMSYEAIGPLVLSVALNDNPFMSVAHFADACHLAITITSQKID